MLGTSLMEDGVTLSSVLGKFGMDEMNEIVSDWGVENTWHWDTAGDFLSVVALVDGHNRS